jgi:deoxyhypusine synthase
MEEIKDIKGNVLRDNHGNVHDFKDIVKGYDFNQGVDYSKVFASYRTMGIQSSQLHKGMELVDKMLAWRGEEGEKCKIFLGYTSNMVSCGNREIIRFLCQHKLIDVICTTAGGIEEDFMKCLADSYIGNFRMNDKQLREDGVNRIGNMLVPNENYCKFEDWINPHLDSMWEKQTKEDFNWTPSKMIDFLGEKINNPESVYYWCHKNKIPVFCPAITDGSIGDMLFFHSYQKKGLRIDLVEDIRAINREAINAKQTGAVILGGGVIKHHIMNANLMRNGADFTVYINTGIEYDASDAGATPNEAVSWGKIQPEGEYVKIFCEASLVFPILVGETFAKKHFKDLEKNKNEEAQN